MKQATKSTRKSTATKQVKRVVATLALATAAGTAATPAFAAECETDRGDDGIGRAFGSDRPGAKFGGAGRGVEVKDDGTVEVRAGGILGGVDDVVSDVVGGTAAVAEGVAKGVVEDPADVVEDVADTVGGVTGQVAGVADTVDDVTDPVEDVVEGVTDSAPDAVGEVSRPGRSGDAPAGSEGKGSGEAAGQGAEKAHGSGEKDSGKKSGDESGKDADDFAPIDIDYSADPGGPDSEKPAADAGASGELVAFEATAQALGFGLETLSGDAERSGDYEPRHMRSASRGGERVSLDTRQATEDAGMSVASSDLLASIGVGSVDVNLLTTAQGLDVNVKAAGVEADVEAGPEGVTLDADVQDIADVAVGANGKGVEASADAAGVANVDAEVGVAGDTDGATAPEADGVAQDASEMAERGVRPFQSDAHAYLGQHAQDALVPAAGAEFLSYQPSEVDRVAEEADAATREATIDAPLRVATTGTEAAALTGLAGALVLGGAGALLVANRGGRSGEQAPVTVPTTTS